MFVVFVAIYRGNYEGGRNSPPLAFFRQTDKQSRSSLEVVLQVQLFFSYGTLHGKEKNKEEEKR